MNNQINLASVKVLREASNVLTANALINAGWILLNTHAISSTHSNQGFEVIYVFGWNKNDDPVNPVKGTHY